MNCYSGFCKNEDGSSENIVFQNENCKKACCTIISQDMIVKFSNPYGLINENLTSIDEWLKKGWKIRTMFQMPINETVVACMYL